MGLHVVLGWVTNWEYLVLWAFQFFSTFFMVISVTFQAPPFESFLTACLTLALSSSLSQMRQESSLTHKVAYSMQHLTLMLSKILKYCNDFPCLELPNLNKRAKHVTYTCISYHYKNLIIQEEL